MRRKSEPSVTLLAEIEMQPAGVRAETRGRAFWADFQEYDPLVEVFLLAMLRAQTCFSC